MKKGLILMFAFLMVFSVLAAPLAAGAATAAGCDAFTGSGIPSDVAACNAAPGCAWDVTLNNCNVIGGLGVVGSELALGTRDIRSTIANIINAALGLLGVVAVVIILLGGLKWMTSAGNDEKVKEAKKLIISGIVGLVIVLTAFAIANYVISSILAGT